MLLIQSHLRASDLFVRQDREGKEGRESQGKSYLPWAFLEAIFLASTPNIHLHLAFDIKACLFTHRSPLIPLFSCTHLDLSQGAWLLSEVPQKQKIGPWTLLAKRPAVWCMVWHFRGTFEKYGSQAPFQSTVHWALGQPSSGWWTEALGLCP